MTFRLAKSAVSIASLSSSSSVTSRWTLIRCLATQTRKPCSDYLSLTHPDGHPNENSSVSKTLNRFNQSVLATYSRPQLLFTRGSGLDLYAAADPNTNDGCSERKYLDFSSGIAVNSLGHSDAEIAEIVGQQSARLVHASNLYHNEWSGELADKMVKLTHAHGGLGLAKASTPTAALKVFLSNSGTEANEAALKFARKAGKLHPNGGDKKVQLVCFDNAFHGRSMGALSVTPNPKYQQPFSPLIPQVHVGKYNSFEALDQLINENTAGVIVEPIQGEGGIFPAKVEWLQALRKKCDEVGAMLIYDEIQCGLFRSGTLWCHSEYPVNAHPDMVTMAKPLANGFPIGAVLMRDRVAELISVGDHGTTFGGGPLTSRIAHHVLGRLSNAELVASMKQSSSHLFQRLTRMVAMFPDLLLNQTEQGKPSPRGKGLLVGISTQDASHAARIVTLARQRGLLLLTAGSDTIRIVPSLTVTREQIDTAMDILESCLVVLGQQQLSSSATCAPQTPSTSRSFHTSSSSTSSTSSTSTATSVPTSETESLYNSFVELSKTWPKDPLRPEYDFGKSLLEATQSCFLVNQQQLKSMTKSEFQLAKSSFSALLDIQNNQISNQFPFPSSLRHPKSNPSHFDRLIKALEKASKGQSTSLSWSEKWNRFFGRQ